MQEGSALEPTRRASESLSECASPVSDLPSAGGQSCIPLHLHTIRLPIAEQIGAGLARSGVWLARCWTIGQFNDGPPAAHRWNRARPGGFGNGSRPIASVMSSSETVPRVPVLLRQDGDAMALSISLIRPTLLVPGVPRICWKSFLRCHAYLLYGTSTRNIVGDLMAGDAAGLAYPQRGERIRPAVESGLLAARSILAANGSYERQRSKVMQPCSPTRSWAMHASAIFLRNASALWAESSGHALARARSGPKGMVPQCLRFGKL